MSVGEKFVAAITVVALAGAIAWFAAQPTWEPAVTALVLLAAVIGLFGKNRQGASASGLDAKQQRKRLAAFLTEAQGLRARLNEQPLPVAEHDAWIVRVRDYLKNNLGPEFEVRFSDFSGMTFYGDSSERSRLSRSLEGHSRRLHQFIEELGRGRQ